ncbi:MULTISPECIES: FAD-dependent oxidoreductase [unclassified Pseudomonas]|uniref:FAD-dependent oxidoreductase n=1 Tax=unclassified Pseudomonas TaxID=196821 RepID=UPI002B23E221|nr:MULTISPECIES: FAD-dependent oxidoreductase [unclassified Pseudomonas]MEA9978266.1 FAD-dependent oxidoreductase [Pseudomonas sp. RTS4]MEB0197778.1 FAD-dependent oxidoreductase [Pseudomonas sp. 5S4]MEB0246895.1 FAD-dependent oxidoreductase [Pseudomonas sp. 10S5]
MALHPVARFADLSHDGGTQVEIGEQKFLLLRLGDEVRAYQALCPHAGAPLVDGAVCNGRLICPWHKGTFAIEDGTLCEPPALDNLKRYPAYVVDGEVRIDDNPLLTSAAVVKDERCFAIIGAGAAGTAAASALRAKGFGGRLLLIDREAQPGYDRTALSKFVIAGEMKPDKIPPLRDEAFYRQHRIERIHGEVTRLEVASKRLTVRLNETGEQPFEYHAALLVTGAEPHSLDVPGAKLPEVLLLRTRQDAEWILHAAPPCAQAVIIGDSFIGLEAASALRKRGMSVTVIARHQAPFSAQFGERIGRAIRHLHEQNGVLFRTHVDVTRFEGAGHLESVVLDTGERLQAELALIGIGVSPAIEWVEGVNREHDGSLRVDGGMQVAEGLWAAGDIVTFPLSGKPHRIEHWRLAQQQARIAAHNMLGAHEQYADVPFFWTYHFGKRFDYLGHAETWDDIVFEGSPEHYNFIALLSQNGMVAAIVACQYQRAMALFAERMKQPLAVDEARRLIRSLSQ